MNPSVFWTGGRGLCACGPPSSSNAARILLQDFSADLPPSLSSFPFLFLFLFLLPLYLNHHASRPWSLPLASFFFYSSSSFLPFGFSLFRGQSNVILSNRPHYPSIHSSHSLILDYSSSPSPSLLFISHFHSISLQPPLGNTHHPTIRTLPPRCSKRDPSIPRFSFGIILPTPLRRFRPPRLPPTASRTTRWTPTPPSPVPSV